MSKKTNVKKKLVARIKGYEETAARVKNARGFHKPGSLSGRK